MAELGSHLVRHRCHSQQQWQREGGQGAVLTVTYILTHMRDMRTETRRGGPVRCAVCIVSLGNSSLECISQVAEERIKQAAWWATFIIWTGANNVCRVIHVLCYDEDGRMIQRECHAYVVVQKCIRILNIRTMPNCSQRLCSKPIIPTPPA